MIQTPPGRTTSSWWCCDDPPLGRMRLKVYTVPEMKGHLKARRSVDHPAGSGRRVEVPALCPRVHYELRKGRGIEKKRTNNRLDGMAIWDGKLQIKEGRTRRRFIFRRKKARERRRESSKDAVILPSLGGMPLMTYKEGTHPQRWEDRGGGRACCVTPDMSYGEGGSGSRRGKVQR